MYVPSVSAAAELLPADNGCKNGCDTEPIAGSPSVPGFDRWLSGSSSRFRFLLFLALLIVAVSAVAVSGVTVSEAVFDRFAFFSFGGCSTAVVHVCMLCQT
jgi:hypothetical protein